MRQRLWWILMAGLLGWPPAAHAEYGVEIVCSRTANIALVRFGWSEAGSPVAYRALPMRIDGGLSHGRPQRRSECQLPNGWKLRIRDGEMQGFAHGMGGADPPAFFSLWVNRRRVLSRVEWKPGYGDSGSEKPWLVGLVIQPDRMSRCEAGPGAGETEPGTGPIACRSERLRLADHRIDRIEYPLNGRKWKEGSWFADPVAADRGFCARYLRTMLKPMFGRPAIYSALQGDERAPLAARLPKRPLPSTPGVELADTEIAPGVRRRLVLRGGSDHFFDGDLVLVLPPDTDVAPLLPSFDFDPKEAGDALMLAPRREWTLLAGGQRGIYPGVSPRYAHFVPQRIDWRLYFLASPANQEIQPTALLLGLKPEGGVRRMCVIRRIEPHF